MIISGLELIALGLLQLAAAGNMQCQAKKPVDVVVSSSKSRIRYDYSKSKKQLDEFDIDTVSPYGPEHKTHVGGLMSSEIGPFSNVELIWETNPVTNQFCLYYSAVEIELKIINPTIYVAKEYKKGSCKHDAILEHEHKHVRVDQEIVLKYTQRMKKAVQQAMDKYGSAFGPFPSSELEAKKEGLQNYVAKIIDSEFDKMNRQRQALQQAVDSREEYDRVAAQCPDEN